MIERHRACERRHGTFGGDVSSAIGNPSDRRGRGHIHDISAAIRFHRRNGVFRTQEHAPHIHRHDVVPLRFGGRHHGAECAAAGIVDQDIDAAKGFDACVDHRFGVGILAHVGLHRDGVHADTSCNSLGCVQIIIRNNDLCAFARE
jgi:hypothetical protein